jgi:hypothetical protein
MSVGDSVSYRSPVSKLLPFFRKSRNKWKAKCMAAKRENKSLKTRLAKMKESRDHWKAKARALKEGLPAESVPVGEDSKRGLL